MASTSARNRAIDRLCEDNREQVSIGPAKPSELHTRNFASVQARNAMNALPVRQRQILSLAFFDKQTPIQIAVSTGASMSSVQIDLRNALLSLKATITSQLIPSRC